MARTRGTVACAAVAAALLAPASPGGDWSQFGGPGRDLTADAGGSLQRGRIELRAVWNRPLGAGYSGFSVAGERAVTLFADGGSDVLVALEAATGEEIWRRVIGPTYRGHSGSEDGPLGTPTIHGAMVYGVGRHGELYAVALEDGAPRWLQRIDRDYGAEPPAYGFSTSPFVRGGVLIVQTGGTDGRSVSGLDPESGALLWSRGDDGVDHQSPLPATLAGKPQVLAVGRREMVGLEAGTGELLWSHRHRDEPEVWAQPVVAGDGVFMSYYSGDGVFFRVSREGETIRVREAWRSDVLKRSYTVPIHYGGLLYGFRGDLLFCVDPANGEEVWASREPGNGGTILVDSHLLTLAPRGELVIAEVSRQGYRERVRTEVLARGSLTPPSFSAGRVYVRNQRRAACVEVVSRQ